MLIVTGVAPAEVGRLELENLVVNVEWPTTEPLHYWRTGDFRYALLEIGVHPQTGQLGSVTVVNIEALGQWSPDEPALDKVAANMGAGVPVFDMTAWVGSLMDEQGDLSVRLGSDGLAIAWGRSPTRYIQSGRVLFGVDASGAFNTVQIQPLTHAEIGLIRAMFDR